MTTRIRPWLQETWLQKPWLQLSTRAPRRPKQRLWLLLAMVAFGVAGAVWAQAPQDDSDTGAPEAVEPAPASAKDVFRDINPDSIADAAVRALVITPGDTPAQMAESARTLADLSRPDLARRLLRALVAQKLDNAQLAAIGDALGAASLGDFANGAGLQPEGKQLAEAALAALSQRSRDPARLAQAIRDLQDPTPAVRGRAIVQLCDSQGYAAPLLIAVLADLSRVGEHAAVRGALAAMGVDAVRPLASTLDSGKPNLVVEALGVLGDLKAGDVKPLIWAFAVRDDAAPEIRAAAARTLRKLGTRVPSREAALGLLTEQAVEHFEGRTPLREDSPGRVVLWGWDESKGQPTPRVRATADASRLLALRFARDALSVAPRDRSALLLYLTILLEETGRRRLDPAAVDAANATLAQVGQKFLPAVIEAVLDQAIRTNHPGAGVTALEILRKQPEAVRLLARSKQPSAVAVAARHADRRLRMAAVETLIAMKPEGDYPGADYVPEALAYFAASTGARRALVVGAIESQSARVAGYLGRLGYEPQRAIDGRQLLVEAIHSPDWELVLVDAGVNYPTIDSLMQQIRRDGRTALLPVGILARPDLVEKSARLAAEDGRSESFAYPYDPQSAEWQVARVLQRAGGGVPAAGERRAQAAQALDWLAQLASDPSRRYYDLRPAHAAVLQAAGIAELSLKAIAVLEHVGTAESQRKLVELFVRDTTAMPVRVEALAAFRRCVERFKLLIPSDSQERLLRVLAEPQLSVTAALLSADFGTPQSQTALLDLAARDEAPLDARRAGLDGLRRSILQYGRMLTPEKIQEQYKRYERFVHSENKDVAIRQVLGGIIECLEDPARSAQPVDRDAQP